MAAKTDTTNKKKSKGKKVANQNESLNLERSTIDDSITDFIVVIAKG